jgi:hypothetical protein
VNRGTRGSAQRVPRGSSRRCVEIGQSLGGELAQAARDGLGRDAKVEHQAVDGRTGPGPEDDLGALDAADAEVGALRDLSHPGLGARGPSGDQIVAAHAGGNPGVMTRAACPPGSRCSAPCGRGGCIETACLPVPGGVARTGGHRLCSASRSNAPCSSCSGCR